VTVVGYADTVFVTVVGYADTVFVTVVGYADTVFVTVVGYADTVFTEHSCATARDSHAIPSSCPPLRVGNHDKQFMSKNLSRSSASFTRCKDTSIPPFGKIKFLTLTC
jgi:hypothetical protein